MIFLRPALTLEEVQLQLGTEPETALEAIENELFSLRTYFVSQSLVIPLFVSRIRRVLWLSAAQLLLLGDERSAPQFIAPPVLDRISASTLEELFRNSESQMAQVKLLLTRAENADELALKAWDMCLLEEEYLRKFVEMTHSIEMSKEAVKASAVPDKGELIWLLAGKGSSEELNKLLALERRRCMDLLSRM